jgi:hypothetical protein
MTTLIDYLANLNTADNGWSLFVNPENIEEYRIGQDCFENGGLDDEWVKVGSLDNLSFGFQNNLEPVECYLRDCGETLDYKGKKVNFNRKGLLEAYSSGCLDSDFQQFLESEADDIATQWSIDEASLWVIDVLPEILKSKVRNK